MRRLLLLAAVLLALAPLASAQYAHTGGTQILDADGRPILLRGINLGNWLNPEGYMWHFDGGPQSAREIEAFTVEMLGPTRSAEFWRRWREEYITREDIHRIHQQGFNSIRVPINWRLFQEGGDGQGFRLLDDVIQWSKSEGLYVIIDLHAAPGGQTGANIDDSDGWPWLFQDEGSQQKCLELWRRIAERYHNEPAVLGYDLLNEPLPHFAAVRPLYPLLEPFYRKLAGVIREEDKNHILILEAALWDSDFKVFGKPFDANVVYEFHVYAFGNPTPETQAAIQQYLDYRDKWQVPLWLGESGENTDSWIAAMRELVEKNDIGWCFWPYKKMDAASSPVTFARPNQWDEIVAYAKGDRNLGNIEDRLKKRPSQGIINAAFASLRQNIGFGEEKVNRGYVKALLPLAQ